MTSTNVAGVWVIAALLSAGLAGCKSTEAMNGSQETGADTERRNDMELGAFSISLAVKDLAASRAFYEKLGFSQIGGNPAQNWIILRNGESTIGLFQGMFEKNSLTFNPGWSGTGNHPENFTMCANFRSV